MYHVNNTFNSTGDHFQGDTTAPLQFIQYGDFLCEHCASVYPAIKSLQEKMGGSLRFIFRHYPLHNVHPLSLEAAKAAEAAAMQGKFWYMHDMIFENQKHLVRSSFSRFAGSIGLDLKTFEDCRDHKKLLHKVINDFESGLRCGVNSTPAFFINGKKYNGFDDLDSLYRTCRYALNSSAMQAE